MSVVVWGILAAQGGVGLVDSLGALAEGFLLGFVEVKFNDLFDAVLAEYAGNTDAEVLFAVFAVEKG